MKRAALVEGILILSFSLVSLIEGFRLIVQMDPQTLSDVLGPGFYILFLSIALMTTGVCHLYINYKETSKIDKRKLKEQIETRSISKIVLYMVLVFIVYVILIEMMGYLLPTILFFFLEFRLAGVKSWTLNIIVSLLTTAVFYVVFIEYCVMSFPRGILFE